MFNIIQNRSHVLCKDCEFVFDHFIFENIDNNIMNKHRFNDECTFKKNERVEKQKLLKKSFQTIFDSFFFIRSIIDLYETRFMRERESFFRYIQQKFNDKLLKFVLNVNFFFNTIESSFFKNFVNYLKRNVDILERIFFDKMMKKRTNQMKDDIFQNFEIETKIFIALNV